MDDHIPPLSEDSIQVFKKLLAKHSGRESTDAEALEAATRVVQFFRALAEENRPPQEA